jgi:hypothetical protein
MELLLQMPKFLQLRILLLVLACLLSAVTFLVLLVGDLPLLGYNILTYLALFFLDFVEELLIALLLNLGQVEYFHVCEVLVIAVDVVPLGHCLDYFLLFA